MKKLHKYIRGLIISCKKRIKRMGWVIKKGKVVPEDVLYLGKWLVATVNYRGTRSKGDFLEYSASAYLPGLKLDLGSFKTKELAKDYVENAVKYWVSNMKLS